MRPVIVVLVTRTITTAAVQLWCVLLVDRCESVRCGRCIIGGGRRRRSQNALHDVERASSTSGDGLIAGCGE